MIATILPLVGRRLAISVLILLIVSMLLFLVLHVLPVDPAAMSLPPTATLADIEAMRHEMGLDKPLPQQYVIWLSHVVHGDFGNSIFFRRTVASLVVQTLPATIELAVLVDDHRRSAWHRRRSRAVSRARQRQGAGG